MATHSRVLAWRIPWTEREPGGLQNLSGLTESARTDHAGTATRVQAVGVDGSALGPTPASPVLGPVPTLPFSSSCAGLAESLGLCGHLWLPLD